MILRTIRHGKKNAIVLSDEILEEAGLSKTGNIQVTVNPTGGLLIQSVEETNKEDACLSAFKKIKRKYSRLFRNLADR